MKSKNVMEIRISKRETETGYVGFGFCIENKVWSGIEIPDGKTPSLESDEGKAFIKEFSRIIVSLTKDYIKDNKDVSRYKLLFNKGETIEGAIPRTISKSPEHTLFLRITDEDKRLIFEAMKIYVHYGK